MGRSPAPWVQGVVALLGLTAVLGYAAVAAAPEGGRVTGIWPVGLATACLVVAARRATPVILGLVGAIAFLTIWLGGRPVEVAAGYAVGTILEVWVVWRLLSGGRAARPSVRTDRELRTFFLATGVGGAIALVTGALTSALTGYGNPGLVGFTLCVSHLASQVTLVPFVLRLPDHGAIAGTRERFVQWVLLAVVTPLVFWPEQLPSVVFLMIPVLAWSALRVAPMEALAQQVLVLACAIGLTTLGRGPFAAVPRIYDLPVDSRSIVLAAYAVTTGFLVLPLVLRVGEQVETTRQAAAQRDRMQSVVGGTRGVAIIGCDAAGRITLFNPGAERLLGYTAEEVLGELTTKFHTASAVSDKAAELGVPDDFRAVATALVQPGVGATELRFRRKDGVERLHSLTLSRIVDERDGVVGWVSTSEDITDTLREQVALEDALDTEREAVERLRQVDAVKDAFVSSVSHELRTPITSMVGYLELLREGAFGELAPAQVDAVDRISGNSDRLLRLIDELLTLSRLQDDEIELVTRAFDLRTAVRSGYDVVAPMWGGRPLDVRLVLPDEPVSFVGDRDMIERVVVNLVSNAVKFTPDGGSVGVELTAERDQATVSVSDTGIGIPVSEQERVFSRFYRSSVAQKQAIPGSGLGLSITRAIIAKHDGRIEVASSGAGSTFRVHLPLVD